MPIQAGLDATKIEIPVKTPMGGYAARSKRSTGEHDPLHVKTLALKVKNDFCIICCCDLVGLEKNAILEVKKRVLEEHGIPVEHVIISATHTHSGPRNIALFGDSFKGHEKIYDTIASSISSALNSMVPVRLKIGKDHVSNVSFNRRTYDKTSEHVDDECITLTVLNEKDEVIGVLYNFACHPVVMGASNLEISADWVYYSNKKIMEAYPGSVPVFLQGPSGNLNPVNTPLVGTTPEHDFNDCTEIGDIVGSAVVEIVRNSRNIDAGNISGRTKDLILNADDEDKKDIFTFSSGEIKDGVFSVKTYVQVISVGNIAFTAIPGELFSQIGLSIKEKSPFDHTMVIGYANDYIGYIATRENYLAGGYETMMMSLSEDEGEIINNGIIELLGKNRKA
ncbi:MAG: neutral/alkaline non-lysosomal ceramidase N-terminal domain-containing protein [Candidatus Hodarchaeota archaeon]